MMGTSTRTMSGGGKGRMSGGAIGLSINSHGTVSFLATIDGSIRHELVILPVSDSQIVGTPLLSANGKVDKAGSLGESVCTLPGHNHNQRRTILKEWKK
jgi:hypothetical protein